MSENLITLNTQMTQDTQNTQDIQDIHMEHLWKICVVGDIGTGKSAFVKRLVHDTFSIHYKSTLGVDFGLKVVKSDNATFRLQLWDIAGQERFGNMLRVYCRETLGVFITVDHTRVSTIDAVKRWKSHINNYCAWDCYPADIIPVILLVSKIDILTGNENTNEYYDEFCKTNGIHSWFAISSQTGEGVVEACDAMINICKKAIIEPLEIIPEKNEDKKLTDENESFLDSFFGKFKQIVAPKGIKQINQPNQMVNQMINPDAYKFIMNAYAIYTENQDDKKIVKLWKRLLVALHCNPNINITETTNKQLFDIITKMHDTLVNVNFDDSEQVKTISNDILNYVKQNIVKSS